MVKVRRGAVEDADTLGEVMWDAIHNGHSAYTPAQRLAWLEKPNAGPEWVKRLARHRIWVASEGEATLGFITLSGTGYIDLAYVHSAAQGRGLFSALYTALEYSALLQRHPRLWTHASLMAQPAFARLGFHVIQAETVTRGDQTLERAEMEKVLQ